MPTQNTNTRISLSLLNNADDILENLQTIEGYAPQREEAAIVTLQTAQEEMVRLQKLETKLKAEYRSAMDAARQAEWQFHNGILEAKNAVIAQFGVESSEVKKVGRKKKSERKRPVRRTQAA